MQTPDRGERVVVPLADHSLDRALLQSGAHYLPDRRGRQPVSLQAEVHLAGQLLLRFGQDAGNLPLAVRLLLPLAVSLYTDDGDNHVNVVLRHHGLHHGVVAAFQLVLASGLLQEASVCSAPILPQGWRVNLQI